jgi:hypothetical protein
VENLSEFEVRTVSEILGLLTQVTNLLTTIFSLRLLCVCVHVHVYVHVHVARVHMYVYRRIHAHSCFNIVVSQTR